jgi:hypothetical protein
VLSCEPLDEVLTQDPAGTTVVTCGSTVDYEYSRYETTMPDILGMTAAEANAAIIAAGLVIHDSNITWGTSSTVDINTVMDQDPNGGDILSCDPHSPKYKLSSGCYPKFPNHTGLLWANWILAGQPTCWCYKNQCYGDTDDATGGITKTGLYYVGAVDLQLLFNNWQILEPPKGKGIVVVGEPNMCADFDHATGGITKTGLYRVGATDLQILFNNWQVLEPPKGPGMAANCP